MSMHELNKEKKDSVGNIKTLDFKKIFIYKVCFISFSEIFNSKIDTNQN